MIQRAQYRKHKSGWGGVFEGWIYITAAYRILPEILCIQRPLFKFPIYKYNCLYDALYESFERFDFYANGMSPIFQIPDFGENSNNLKALRFKHMHIAGIAIDCVLNKFINACQIKPYHFSHSRPSWDLICQS